MNCRSVREKISAAVLEALDSAEHEQVLGHLACCPGCYAEFDRTRLVAHMAAGGTVPGGLDRLVRQTLQAARDEMAKEGTVWSRFWQVISGMPSKSAARIPLSALRPAEHTSARN